MAIGNALSLRIMDYLSNTTGAPNSSSIDKDVSLSSNFRRFYHF